MNNKQFWKKVNRYKKKFCKKNERWKNVYKLEIFSHRKVDFRKMQMIRWITWKNIRVVQCYHGCSIFLEIGQQMRDRDGVIQYRRIIMEHTERCHNMLHTDDTNWISKGTWKLKINVWISFLCLKVMEYQCNISLKLDLNVVSSLFGGVLRQIITRITWEMKTLRVLWCKKYWKSFTNIGNWGNLIVWVDS